MEKIKQLFKLAQKNKFKTFVLVFQVIIVAVIGFDVYARTAGKISEPFGGWPTDDKGYVGYPSDATINTTIPIAADDTIYSMLGKIYNKANSGSPSGTWNVCGICYQYGYSNWGPYPSGAVPRGCCGDGPGSFSCAAPADGQMILIAQDTVGYPASGSYGPNYWGTMASYYVCYR